MNLWKKNKILYDEHSDHCTSGFSDRLRQGKQHSADRSEFCGRYGIDTGYRGGVQEPDTEETEGSSSAVTELYVRFGDDGETFVLHLYDNETAAAIAYHVGTTDWRLPIYHYDDFDNWEVMQYYDIPSRYGIPDNAENITSERGGTVHYSDPNRLILFYQDAEVSGDYTLVGYFDYTEEFVTAVEENPVLEGWGNKINIVSAGE